MEDVLNEALQPLFERQDAIELMFVGLAIALHESGSAPLPKTVEAIEFIRLFAEMTESPAVSEKFGPTLDRLRVARDDGARPRTSFLRLLAMHATTQPRLRDALRSWLSQATPDEIADDLKDLLGKLERPSGGGH